MNFKLIFFTLTLYCFRLNLKSYFHCYTGLVAFGVFLPRSAPNLQSDTRQTNGANRRLRVVILRIRRYTYKEHPILVTTQCQAQYSNGKGGNKSSLAPPQKVNA
jgi:hypothetical protein